MGELDPQVLASLRRLAVIGPDETPAVSELPGGVSGEVFRLDLKSGPVCVKRALEQLRVAKEWKAPLERSKFEVRWLKAVFAIDPDRVPRVIASDAQTSLFVMEYLEPERHPIWKAELRDGRIDEAFAAAVGGALGLIHRKTAGREEMAQAFDTSHLFNALRVDPYLLTTARVHPDLAGALEALAAQTLGSRIALVQGDISPKNILVGPKGPVFLDAECAWYGDPAFDLAFVLNHLLLKSLWRPAFAQRYFASFKALLKAYLHEVDWEPRAELERRTAALLPALLLARVDGKSPVEYLTEPKDKDLVRSLARPLIKAPADKVEAVLGQWAGAVELK